MALHDPVHRHSIDHSLLRFLRDFGLSTKTQKRVVGGFVVIAIVAITIAVFLKRQAAGGLASGAVTEGLSHLAAGIQTGEARRFDEAEASFKKAASLSIVDYYPAFLIQTTRRLSDKAFDDAPPGQSAVLRAVSERRWDDATKETEKLGAPGSKPRVFYEELIKALQRTSGEARSPTP